MLERLQPAADVPGVAEVRGVGLMLGVELEEGIDAGPVAAAALKRGVVVRASGQKIVLSPPLVIEEEQADRVVDTLIDSLGALE
jgi:adenosylmethionine-8-amino-7-oxononanoate aminotransferase